jgi:hypothetical protein
MVHDSQNAMSPYEASAWSELREESLRRQRQQLVNSATRERISSVTQRIGERVRAIPGAEDAEAVVAAALEGLRGMTMDWAMMSVNEERVLAKFRKRGATPATLADLRDFDLERCDKAIPRLRARYTSAAAGEGALSALAITGLEVKGKVKGGPGIAAVGGAIAVDTSFVLAGMGRCIAETGAYYGFDVSQDEEQLFALAIMAYSSATTRAGKVAAMAELSRLTQMMMRRATWQVLSKEPIVKVIQAVYTRLGIRLTHQGLGRAVPLVGVVVGSGLNAAALQRVGRDAKMAYRIRFLATKYNLDPDDMVDVEVNASLDDEETIRFELPTGPS